MDCKLTPPKFAPVPPAQQQQKLLTPPKLLQEPQSQIPFAERTRQAVLEVAPALKKYLGLLFGKPDFGSQNGSEVLAISSCGECAGVLKLLLASRGLQFRECMRTEETHHVLLLSEAEPTVTVDANYLALFWRGTNFDLQFLPSEEILVIEGNRLSPLAREYFSLRKKFLENQAQLLPSSSKAQEELEYFKNFGEAQSLIFSRIWDAAHYSPMRSGFSELLAIYASEGGEPAHLSPLVDALKQDGVL